MMGACWWWPRIGVAFGSLTIRLCDAGLIRLPEITRLLQAQMFRVERRDAALYVPPFTPLMRAPARLGKRRAAPFAPARWAGLCLIEAEKDIFAAMPAGAAPPTRAAARLIGLCGAWSMLASWPREKRHKPRPALAAKPALSGPIHCGAGCKLQ
jgi:hypothetical protein